MMTKSPSQEMSFSYQLLKTFSAAWGFTKVNKYSQTGTAAVNPR